MTQRELVKQHRYYWDDADHLIKLAREYESQAKDNDSEKGDGYYLYWKYRLARMSFIARMMSIEALLNNILEEFSLPEKFKELEKLEDSFPRKERFPKNRRKRKGRPYQVPLKWKLYLTPYLCIENSRMLRDEFFAFELGAYRKFRQLIMIRNEFVHTRVVDRGIDIQMDPVAPEAQKDHFKNIMISPEFTDCCQEMGIDQDPVCFQVDNARVCGSAMREIVLELNYFLDGRILTKDFWESDHQNVAP
jgi:hypothetical protein